MRSEELISDNFFVNPTMSVDRDVFGLDKLLAPTTFDGSVNDVYAKYPTIQKPEYVGKLKTGDSDSSIQSKKTFPGADVPSAARVIFDSMEQVLGYKDSREMPNSTYGSPAGHIYLSKNMKTGNVDIYPAQIKETIETVKKSPIGPKRSSETHIRRRNVSVMYGVPDDVMSSFLGYDSNGVPRYSEGNSYIERCIFTGYYKSFTTPSAVLNNVQLDRPSELFPNATLGINLNQKVFGDDIVWISKSGLYYTRSLPVNNIFLGYNDNDVIPRKTPLTWLKTKDIKVGGNSSTSYKPRSIYSDQIALFELRNHKNIDIEGSPAGSMIGKNDQIKSFPIHESLYWSDREIKRMREMNILDPNSILNCTAKSYIKDSKDVTEGSYRQMLYNLSKVDILEYVFEKGEISVSLIESIQKSSKIDFTYPQLKRRSEQYGPNPMQHLFYMDFYDWRKYETLYISKIPSGPFFDLSGVKDRLSVSPSLENLYRLAGDTFQLPNDKIGGLGNVYVYSNGRINDGLSRHPNLSDSAVLLSDRFTLPNPEVPNVFIDNTYILDVYFGLMELHLKSFSWKTIMTIIDMIPQFYGDHLDSPSVNWKSKSPYEKSSIRIKQLNESLKPIWDIITKLLYEYELQYSEE